jgi:dihydroorotase
MGMVGLESALRVVYATMVEPGTISWRDVARIMSEAPARIGRADDAGRPIAVGEPANLTAFDPSAGGTFTEADLAGKSTNSPFLGMELPGAVTTTIFRGVPTLREGNVVIPGEES